MLCKDFKYKGLLDYFKAVSDIPRPTFAEEKIADYLCDFASSRGLEYYRDNSHNVLIKKQGSIGREREAAILLQGHTDMVCEKNSGVEHDFLCEGLDLYEENGWIRARGTTLGADNGVAVAVMLYILDGALDSHPPIECLFTSAEEVGLIGANAFDYSKIAARQMINMDSADESQIICGCAGGQRSTLKYDLIPQKSQGNGIKITIKGLAGGHSGEDINRGRANANKLMGRILNFVWNEDKFNLISINGGSKDNAIPRECVAEICVRDAQGVIALINKAALDISKELCADDRNFEVLAESFFGSEKMISLEQTEKIIFLLSTVQNGVIEMNTNIPELVEFSRNLGIVLTKNDRMEFTFMARSPKKSHINVSAQQLLGYANMLGMSLALESEYPGWDFSVESPIREKYAQSYRELYGKDPTVTAIHAGLECGIIKEKVPDMDIISCGPIVLDLHSPDEALNIESFEKFFTVIKNTLEK